MERERRLVTLLNTLEAERHVRGPLLLEVLDELESAEPFAPAAAVARRLLRALEAGRLRDGEFHGTLAELRRVVESQSTSHVQHASSSSPSRASAA